MSIFRSVTTQLLGTFAIAVLALSLGGCCCCGGGGGPTITTPDDGTITVDADDVSVTDTDAGDDDVSVTDTDADSITVDADDTTISSDGDPTN